MDGFEEFDGVDETCRVSRGSVHGSGGEKARCEGRHTGIGGIGSLVTESQSSSVGSTVVLNEREGPGCMPCETGTARVGD